MGRPIPGILWIAIISLTFMLAFKLLACTQQPKTLVSFVLSSILLFGIIKGYKWAYVLTIISVAWGTGVMLFREGIISALLVFAVDCLVLLPVVLCQDYFFQDKGKDERAQNPLNESY